MIINYVNETIIKTAAPTVKIFKLIYPNGPSYGKQEKKHQNITVE